ncbi:MAG: hypothetical protein V4507_14415 [Verrucomicrobiota bacterium]
MNRYALLFLVILTGALTAFEVPVKDLTQESPSPSVHETLPIRKALPVNATSSPPTTPSSSPKLELALREIQLLRKAAQAAGGDLEVIIRPTGGISAEDLVIPLNKSGAFEIKPGKAPGSIRVESKSLDSEISNQKEELAQLRKVQKQLIENIKQSPPPPSSSNSIPTVILK